MTTTEIKPTASPAPITRPLGVFTGRYAKQQEQLFDEAQKLFGLTPAQADKFAIHAAQDAATALHSVSANFKIGKANDDGKATITDAAKQKGITLTNALHMVRAMQWIGEAGKNNISYGNTKWKLSEPLQKYVDEVLS